MLVRQTEFVRTRVVVPRGRLLVLGKLRCDLRRETVATRLLVLGELRCGLRRKTV